jgi:hypothetical protein
VGSQDGKRVPDPRFVLQILVAYHELHDQVLWAAAICKPPGSTRGSTARGLTVSSVESALWPPRVLQGAFFFPTIDQGDNNDFQRNARRRLNSSRPEYP